MLRNFFNRNKKLAVNQITFHTFDWKLNDDFSNFKSWIKSDETAFVGIEIFHKKYPCNPFSLKEIILYERQQAVEEFNGGIISCNVHQVNDFTYATIITKTPQHPVGISYEGVVVIPLANQFIKILLKHMEVGTTGMREATIFPKWMMDNPDFESDEDGKIIGWLKDPYNSTYRKGNPMNLAEDEKYDEHFPDHPLTRVRNGLNKIKATLHIDDNVKKYR